MLVFSINFFFPPFLAYIQESGREQGYEINMSRIRHDGIVTILLVVAFVDSTGSFTLFHAPHIKTAAQQLHGACILRRRVRGCLNEEQRVGKTSALTTDAGKPAAPTPDANRRGWQPRSGKKPLVILIGFLGCTPGIIAKYSAVYKAIDPGIEIVQILPSIPSMLLAHQGWRGRGSSRVRQACDLMLERAADSEIIVHLMSNNGFVFFGSCLLAQPGLSDRISALVFDSAPSYITPRIAAVGLLSALQRVEASPTESADSASPADTLLERAVTPLLRGMERRQQRVWCAWAEAFPRAPHLLLYSRADRVVAAAEVEAFANAHAVRLAALGCACVAVPWQTAQHCGLLREDASKYSEQVASFLRTYV